MCRFDPYADWYIQAGSQAMTATAGDQRAFMLGGDGVDYLTGGSQADVLVGNGDGDTLSGGTGADLMIGGAGIDTYFIEGNDSIRDSGNNLIYYQGKLIAGSEFLTDKKSLNLEPCPNRVVRQIYDGDYRGRQMDHGQWRMAA